MKKKAIGPETASDKRNMGSLKAQLFLARAGEWLEMTLRRDLQKSGKRREGSFQRERVGEQSHQEHKEGTHKATQQGGNSGR